MSLKFDGRSIGRNEPCPCHSGKKFKRCCLPKLPGNLLRIAGEISSREHRDQAAPAAAPAAPPDARRISGPAAQ